MQTSEVVYLKKLLNRSSSFGQYCTKRSDSYNTFCGGSGTSTENGTEITLINMGTDNIPRFETITGCQKVIGGVPFVTYDLTAGNKRFYFMSNAKAVEKYRVHVACARGGMHVTFLRQYQEAGRKKCEHLHYGVPNPERPGPPVYWELQHHNAAISAGMRRIYEDVRKYNGNNICGSRTVTGERPIDYRTAEVLGLALPPPAPPAPVPAAGPVTRSQITIIRRQAPVAVPPEIESPPRPIEINPPSGGGSGTKRVADESTGEEPVPKTAVRSGSRARKRLNL